MERGLSYTKIIVFTSLTLGLTSVVYWWYKARCKQKDDHSVKVKSEISPTSVLLVASNEEWESAYKILLSNLGVLKVIGFDCEWCNSKNSRSESRDHRQPVSLLQLASISGVCVLVRLHMLETVPETLKDLLADRSILKVGVACLDDASKLLRDRSLTCAGCVDLRHVAHRSSRTFDSTTLGLQGLAREVLGVHLEKDATIRRSNWEAISLSPAQVRYAALDALVAVHIFLALIDMKYGIKRDNNQDQDATLMKKALSVCQGLTDAQYSPRASTVKKEPNGGKKGTPVCSSSLKGSRAYVVRKKPLYHNGQLLSPDGQLLCTCDLKKANWYIDKGLAVKISDDPFAVQLLFEPNGRPSDASNYYLHEKENICVVCGAAESYIRKNVIPREFRRHFPALLKEHKSHDVLLLCVMCHQRSNIYDNNLKQKLVSQFLPGASLFNGHRNSQDVNLTKVKSAAKALMSTNADRIPESRRTDLGEVVKRFYGVEHLSIELLQQAVSMDTELKQDTALEQEQGELVVRCVVEHMEGGLVEFEKLWRQHFLDTMQPRHMPAFWSVDHSHDQLRDLENSVLTRTVV